MVLRYVITAGAALILAIVTLWYLIPGTIISILTIVLQLVPSVRAAFGAEAAGG